MKSTYDIANIDQSCISAISRDLAWMYKIIPIGINENVINLLSSSDRSKTELEQELEILINRKVNIDFVSEFLISDALQRYYRKTESKALGSNRIKDNPDFISQLIQEAFELKSSDIHIEARENDAPIRMRIDGKLIERFKISKKDLPAIINKIKIKANLDISEKRLPQDGRIKFAENDISMDLRVSIIPTIHGEKIVMRLLNKDAGLLRIDDLGLSKQNLKSLKSIIQSHNGIILISGPTGSGKTTTLYATLSELNTGDNNILTIEDPIEYTMNGINQVQLKESIGLDFSKALKSFLRQDPDIIMVGEIRDSETANMAIRAALTGHLVFSTIHTNSAWATISRLLDMGIPPFLVASTLKLSIAQRLVRKLCVNCKQEIGIQDISIPDNLLHRFKSEKVFTAVGCEVCYFTGYQGRIAVHEVIPIDADLSAEIRNRNVNEHEIIAEYKIHSLSNEAINLVLNGITSIEEIYPIILNSK